MNSVHLFCSLELIALANKGKSVVVRLICAVILLAMGAFAHAESSSAVQSRTDIFYGDDPNRSDRELQSLDVYWTAEETASPVIIYVHGGGWAFGDKSDVNHKADFFASKGFTFISMNYRLRWDSQLFDQAQDIVSVVAWVKKNAANYAADARRIILMGHEAGGHLVSLVGTDSRHLKSQDYKLADISAVVSIDSVSYDIPRVHRELGSFVERRQHRLVFGEDEGLQEESSPIFHVKRRLAQDKEKPTHEDLPAFALLFNPDDEASTLQTEAFAKALTQANSSIIMIPSNTKTKRSINVDIGAPGDIPTGALMAFLRASS